MEKNTSSGNIEPMINNFEQDNKNDMKGYISLNMLLLFDPSKLKSWHLSAIDSCRHCIISRVFMSEPGGPARFDSLNRVQCVLACI